MPHSALMLSAMLASWLLWPGSDAGILEQQRKNLERQIERLPDRRPFVPCNAVGFHSRWADKADTPLSVTLELREEAPLDSIFLVPAFAPLGWGYGFPFRYRVEVSVEPTFKAPVLLLDRTHEDYPVPNGPIQISGGGVGARWIRLTATRLRRQPQYGQGYFLCLGEIFAYSRGRNVALGCKVDVSSSNIPYYPTWAPENLVDGLTSLGLPVESEVKLVQNTNINSGWHSADGAAANVIKWVQMDLGRSVAIQEIRAVPANPVTFTNQPGFGFPVRFKIELSETPDFEFPFVAVDQTKTDFPNPGENIVAWRIPNLTGRHVRFTATCLFLRWNDYVFALSEMEVVSGGVNVARGATVRASDNSANLQFKPEYLVDGRSSSGILLDPQNWLSSLAVRADLELQLEKVRTLEQEAQKKAGQRWLVLGWGGGFLALGAFGGFVLRTRRQRLRQLGELRQQIARDLHDEIGSSLGSIALISELGKQDADLSSLEEIHQLAVDAADSMRGILWMIRDGKSATLRQLEEAMCAQSKQALRGIECEFFRKDSPPDVECTLSFHRNVFLFLKEGLHNITRHAEASKVTVHFEWAPRRLRLVITDNGKGFDVDARHSGSGLANMRHRAQALNASLVMTSECGKGTCITLEAILL